MAGPTYEAGNIIYFDAADQETATAFRIRAIVWSSNQGSNLDIAADDDMLLEDGAGNVVCGKRAEVAEDGLEISFGERGITVIGLKAEDLDGGVLFVYGDRL
jgi:hypothetical protein